MSREPERTTAILVRVTLDLNQSEPEAAAARMLLDIITHGIGARRYDLPVPWLGFPWTRTGASSR